MRHLLKAAQLVPDDDKAITYAIDTVASSKDDKLANQLIDFLLGSDGLPKVCYCIQILLFKLLFEYLTRLSICSFIIFSIFSFVIFMNSLFLIRIRNISSDCTWLENNIKKQLKQRL